MLGKGKDLPSEVSKHIKLPFKAKKWKSAKNSDLVKNIESPKAEPKSKKSKSKK